MIKLFHRNNRHLPEVANESVQTGLPDWQRFLRGERDGSSGAGLRSFTFQDPTHLWRRQRTGSVERSMASVSHAARGSFDWTAQTSFRKVEFSRLTHMTVQKQDNLTWSPSGPSGTSWAGCSFSRFLALGSAPRLSSNRTTSTWACRPCSALAMCSTVFPLNACRRHHTASGHMMP